jgi:hypothetical protein
MCKLLTKDYKIGKNAALMSKNKEWSGQNQNNVSEWNDISTHRLLFQWTSTLKIQLRVLAFSFFVSKCNWYAPFVRECIKSVCLRHFWCSNLKMDGPLPKLCPVIPTSNQDGRQAKHQKCLKHTDFIHSLTKGAYQFYVGPFKKFYLMFHNMIIYKLHV